MRILQLRHACPEVAYSPSIASPTINFALYRGCGEYATREDFIGSLLGLQGMRRRVRPYLLAFLDTALGKKNTGATAPTVTLPGSRIAD